MGEQAKKFDRTASPLVSAAWLEEHLNNPEVRVVDVRWFSRYENGRGISLDDYDGYCEGHIPGAVFAGMVGNLSDPHRAVPDMLAASEQFSQEMSRLGIGENTMVVTCDNMGFPLASARLWWALSYYGHDRVRILDGGLREWTTRERPLSKDIPAVKTGTCTARPRPGWIATGVTQDRPVITYCGLGYAGACGLLALRLLGCGRACLYDGSWAEWSSDQGLPVELGTATRD